MADAILNFTGVDRTRAVFSRVKRNLRDLTRQLGGFKSALFAAAGIGGLGALVKSSLDSVDALGKTSDALGVEIGALQGFQLAAELTGVSTEGFNKSLANMSRRLSEAATGTGTAARALNVLGVDAKEIAGLAPDQAFERLADAFQNLENPAQRAQTAFDIFGRQGIDLLNTLDLGSEGLREISQELDDFGVALTRVDAARLEEANDSFTRLSGVFGGVANIFTAELAGFLTSFTNSLVKSAKESGGFRESIRSAFQTVINLVPAVVAAFNLLRAGFLTLRAGLLNLVAAWVTDFNKLVNFTLEAVNKIRGFFGADAIPTETFFGSLALSLQQSAADANANLEEFSRNVFTQGTVVKEQLQAILDERRNAVEIESKLAQEQTRIEDVEGRKRAELAAQRERERLASRIENLRQSFLTETETLNEQFEQRRELINTAFAQEIIDQQQRNEFMAQLTAEHEAKLTAIKKREEEDRAANQQRSFQQEVNDTAGKFANLFSTANVGNRRLFNIQKKFNLGQALMSAYTAFNAALSNPPGPPFTIPMASFALAKGLLNVARIRSTGFGGGGGVGGGGGGAPAITTPTTAATAITPTQQTVPTQNVSINLQGRAYGRDEVVDLIDAINDAIGDGAQVNVAAA